MSSEPIFSLIAAAIALLATHVHGAQDRMIGVCDMDGRKVTRGGKTGEVTEVIAEAA